jgi:hypothetical protein
VGTYEVGSGAVGPEAGPGNVHGDVEPTGGGHSDGRPSAGDDDILDRHLHVGGGQLDAVHGDGALEVAPLGALCGFCGHVDLDVLVQDAHLVDVLQGRVKSGVRKGTGGGKKCGGMCSC